MNWLQFINILIIIESSGDINAIGDHHMKDKAYGILQIRQPYLDDVNRIANTKYTIEDVYKSETISKWATLTYLRHYGNHYEKVTGKKATPEIYARIHNGGPNGWKKSSTKEYWNKVNKLLNLKI